MAIGPIARALAQIAVVGISVLARALPAAYAQAVANAKKGGVDAASTAMKKSTMLKSEALEILNLEKNYTKEMVKKQYDKYFEANSLEKGGSYYLQSKIYRAKEMLDQYEAEKEEEEEEKKKAKQKQ